MGSVDKTVTIPVVLEAEEGCNSQKSPRETIDTRSPVFIIESRRRTVPELRELWAHRDLFYILAWRDIKVRYKQSMLGATWAILQPLLTMVIFAFLFGRLARIPSEGEPYALFSYAGLLPWTFFSAAVTNSSLSLINNTNLVTKVYFPRILIPLAVVGAALLDLAISSLMLLVIMPFYRVRFQLAMIMLFPVIVLVTVTAAAVGALSSALNVKYRDIRHALPFVMQIWMFLTPVIYPVNFLPHQWRWLLRLNPLSGIVEGFRAAIFGHGLDWQGLAMSTVIAMGLLVVSSYSFRRMEQQFADVI